MTVSPTQYRISYALLAPAVVELNATAAAMAASKGGDEINVTAAAANLTAAEGNALFTSVIPAGGPLFASVAGLSEGALYAFRAHSVDDSTGQVDPVGSPPVLASPAGNRAGFALQLGRPCLSGPCTDYLNLACQFESMCPQVVVAPPGDAAGKTRLQPAALTLEAWVLIDSALEPSSPERLLGVAGDAYSVERGLPTAGDIVGSSSGASGNFGYGLFCRRPGAGWLTIAAEQLAEGWTCGMFCGVRGGNGGSARGIQVVALGATAGVSPGKWTHLAGTYSPASGGTCTLFVDGVAAGPAVAAPGGLLYSADPAVYLSSEETATGLVTPGLPDTRMGFGIGRLVLAGFANTAAQVLLRGEA